MCRDARDGLDVLWDATQQDPVSIVSAGQLAPGDAIHTHPLHPHRNPAQTLPSIPVAMRNCRGANSALQRQPTTVEDQLRRILFMTYGKTVSAEDVQPIFSRAEFVAQSSWICGD
jgi:hypothetical protein